MSYSFSMLANHPSRHEATKENRQWYINLLDGSMCVYMVNILSLSPPKSDKGIILLQELFFHFVYKLST